MARPFHRADSQGGIDLKFEPTSIPQVFFVEIEWGIDDRGRFGRAVSAEELRAHGLVGELAQANVS